MSLRLKCYLNNPETKRIRIQEICSSKEKTERYVIKRSLRVKVKPQCTILCSQSRVFFVKLTKLKDLFAQNF